MPAPNKIEQRVIDRLDFDPSIRLACQLRPEKNIQVNPEELTEIAEKFITNNGKDPTMSVNPEKAIISLEDEYCSYETYIAAQNSLASAYRKIRDSESVKLYGKKYDRLDKEKQTIIKKAFPQKISEADSN